MVRSPANTARRPKSRRSDTLDTAAKLFAERGFGAVSVDDIGRASSMTGPALYQHFPGKDAVLAEIVWRTLIDLLNACRSIEPNTSWPLSGPARLEDIVAQSTRFAFRRPAEFIVWRNESRRVVPMDRNCAETHRALLELWHKALLTRLQDARAQHNSTSLPQQVTASRRVAVRAEASLALIGGFIRPDSPEQHACRPPSPAPHSAPCTSKRQPDNPAGTDTPSEKMQRVAIRSSIAAALVDPSFLQQKAPMPVNRMASTQPLSHRHRVIRQAAATLLAAQGFERTPLAQIGQSCGIAASTIYRYFPNKTALLVDIFEQVIRQLTELGMPLISDRQPPAEVINDLISSYVHFAISNPDLVTLGLRETHRLPSEIRHRYRTVIRKIEGRLRTNYVMLHPEQTSIEASRVITATREMIDQLIATYPHQLSTTYLHRLASTALDTPQR